MTLRTCITPGRAFEYAAHRPSYAVDNLRLQDHLLDLGALPDGTPVDNRDNFPPGDIRVDRARTILEIPNAFAFRGTTYIDTSWAASRAKNPSSIHIPSPPGVSLSGSLDTWASREGVSQSAVERLFAQLPREVLLAMATTSTDPGDLKRLAALACDLRLHPKTRAPSGLWYRRESSGNPRPCIHDHELYEAVANNPHLPDPFKEVMVLRPGVQGPNAIVGEWCDDGGRTHIFEYLRDNSYIPWGHYAANFAHDAVRYRAADLSLADMQGMRHLYFQRVVLRLARQLSLDLPPGGVDHAALEKLRRKVLDRMRSNPVRPDGPDSPHSPWMTATLWGWNFGFDFAPSGYRLHASHQQVHQQNALVPDSLPALQNRRETGRRIPAYGCGDLVAEQVRAYRRQHGQGLFDDYVSCLRSNTRLDEHPGESDLVVFEDAHVLLFVPKAQTSQWELQLMPKAGVGNLLEAGTECRKSLDLGLLLAVRCLEGLGAGLITCIEYPKRFTEPDTDQRLLYAFLPRLPWSPGAFSEAQLRFICGHYPEDFARACRMVLPAPEALGPAAS